MKTLRLLHSEIRALISDINNWFKYIQLRSTMREDGILTVEQFKVMLDNYKRKIRACSDDPTEVDAIGRSFEAAFPIGSQMAHLMGNLETWIHNKKSRKYESIPWSSVKFIETSTFQGNEIQLVVDNIRILLSKKYEISGSDSDWRDLTIYASEELVASYVLTRYKYAEYDWGEDYINSKSTPITKRFIPGEWLLRLNNLYYSWNEEYKLLEKQRNDKFEMDQVKSKYL